MKKRVGLYYWAGPGTVRMIKLKYPGAMIDVDSHMRAYDYDVLARMKEKLGITDAWVSYSWGFGKDREKEDYEFVVSKLGNFKRLGIRTHAYVQGFNLVHEDYKDRDYFCRDPRNGLIPYHRGRKVACPNNPKFGKYLKSKVNEAMKHEFDGVFVDNVHFGLFPMVVGGRVVTFFGCSCGYCKKKFKRESGEEIPSLFSLGGEVIEEYKRFRVESMIRLLKELSKEVRKSGREFGTNSFDPRVDMELVYGTSLLKLASIQDYLLFENHDLPRKGRSNKHVGAIVKRVKKDVFVVSYKRGIGREAQYGQEEFDRIYSESRKVGYSPCYKGGEYKTSGVWHVLDVDKIDKPGLVEVELVELERMVKGLPFARFGGFYNRFYLSVLNRYYENRVFRKALNWLYYRAIG